MKKLIRISICVCSFLNVLFAQELPYTSYGDKDSPPLLFLHGGPGYNSVVFEKTTAQAIADSGFYVLSYDRRGEGRNDSLSAAYTFEQSVADIRDILVAEKIDKVTLLGHSFGGVIAVKFAEAHPKNMKTIVLAGAPVSMPRTLKNIITKSKKIYTDKNDQSNLYYIDMLEKMDSTSLAYSSYSFMHAMNNGFYTTDRPTAQAQTIYKLFTSDEELKSYSRKMGRDAPAGFWKNEQYTSIDLSEQLVHIKNLGIPIHAVYGADDGLYNKAIVQDVRDIIGNDNVAYLEQASHSVFIDRQDRFIELLQEWLKN